MAIDEAARHHLHSRLIDTIGPGAATALMEHLPPVGWADVATKTDLAHLEASLRHELHTEINELRTELRTEINELRTEIAELRTEVRTEINELRAELRIGIAELRAEVRADRIAAQRQLLFVLAAGVVSVIATIVSAIAGHALGWW